MDACVVECGVPVAVRICVLICVLICVRICVLIGAYACSMQTLELRTQDKFGRKRMPHVVARRHARLFASSHTCSHAATLATSMSVPPGGTVGIPTAVRAHVEGHM